MNAHAEKGQESKSQSTAQENLEQQNDLVPAQHLVDNRPEAIAQRQLQEIANNSSQVRQAALLQAKITNASKQSIQRKGLKNNEPVQGKFVQKQGSKETPIQGNFQPDQLQDFKSEELLQGSSTESKEPTQFNDGPVEPALPPRPAGATPPEILGVLRQDAVKTLNAELAVRRQLTSFAGLHDQMAVVVSGFTPEGDWGGGVVGEAKSAVYDLRRATAYIRMTAEMDLDKHDGKLTAALARADKPDLSADDAWESYMAVASAAGAFMGIQAEIQKTYVTTVPEIMKIARIGINTNDPEFVAKMGAIADKAKESAELPPTLIPDFENRSSASFPERAWNWVQNTWGAGDFTNNLGGIVSGVAGLAGVTLGGVIGSVLFAAFGTLFGAVGVLLAGRAAVRSGAKAKKLQQLVPTLSSSAAKEIAIYASQQKSTKEARAVGVAAASGVAVGAGILGTLTVPAVAGALGLAAATVATLGVAAAIAGVIAACIGIGMVAWKWWHGRKKKKQAINQFVDGVIAKATADPPEPEALRLYEQANRDPANLRSIAASQLTSARQDMAKSTVGLLVSGKPSEQLDAEFVLSTLGIASTSIREQVAAGDSPGAADKVASKLASW